MNTHGQVVAQKDIEETNRVGTSVNTSSLPLGVYIIFIGGDNWRVVRKVIVGP